MHSLPFTNVCFSSNAIPTSDISERFRKRLRGDNLTLTCSYEEKQSDQVTVCKWSEIPRGVDYPISRMYLLYNQSTCIKTFPGGNQYGYGCQRNTVLSTAIFNV
ncbi:hypothetical protein DPMN_150945 [Dreissena polymorpha]|uniref:Uncharacterized protein n=1 Tax=Dreissena polymorpha TaxID=45954 RepID=A0A9D4FEP4_DREPO|nr:hypothetical protein DPMN_150945 [Dreissena polymorpha]